MGDDGDGNEAEKWHLYLVLFIINELLFLNLYITEYIIITF